MAGAAPQLQTGDKYQDQPRVVACPRSVILGLRLAVLESFTSGPHGGAEVYGILFGTYGGHEVRISEFQPIAFQSAMAGATPLSEEERTAFAAALESVAKRIDPKGLKPVGWFRAHPHSELSLTGRDLEIADSFFPDPHQVVMILRPSDSQQSLVRFFYRDSAGILKAESSFCEFSVPPSFDAPLMVEGTPGREAAADGAQLAIHEPGLPERSPLDSAAEDEDTVLQLPEPPRVEPRRVNLVWPVVLATAVGTLMAWYWLTRPSDRLALLVTDAGGQLRIVWDPVPNGEAGKLDIADGGARFTITLTPDQLRFGELIVSRQSENVSVRLEARRRGAGPLSETATFRGKNATPASPAESNPPATGPPPNGSASRDAPKQATPVPPAADKPGEVVVSVPVTKPRAPTPKFTAPTSGASRPAEQPQELAPPPTIAQSLPPVIPGPAEGVSEPASATDLPAAPKPTFAPPPPRAPSVPAAPTSGRIIWIGHLQKNQEFWISGKSSSTGTVVGQLPGKPVKLSIMPGDVSGGGFVLYSGNPQYANTVIESPGAQNSWNKTSYTWNPKLANDVTVTEAPKEENQWNRIVLQSKNPRTVIFIDWTLAN